MKTINELAIWAILATGILALGTGWYLIARLLWKTVTWILQ